MTTFWSWYVTILSLGTIFALTWLIFGTRKGQRQETTEETVGHSFDGIEEYDNPLPKWWFMLFVATIVFALGYLALYPGLGNFKGMLGWTSAGQHTAEVAKMDAAVKPLYDKYKAMDLQAVAADKQAMEMGKRLYLTYCMQCHGADARGAKGFPNLADADWQWDGEPTQIVETITNGRMGVMPPHEQLGAETITDLANYVRSLSGLPNDSVRAGKGATAFNEAGCSGCHGPDGKGMQALGAPNLTDKTWLYGSSVAKIVETIVAGRQNQMPAWKEFLGDAKIHLLSAYVLGLSSGGAK